MQQDTALTDVAKSATYNNSIKFKTGIKMKMIGTRLFGSSEDQDAGVSRREPNRLTPKGEKPIDIDKKKNKKGKPGAVAQVIQFIFFDYDKIDFNFNQTNTSQNSGVFGGTGFNNFWRTFGALDNHRYFGPSAAYQFGLISNPHGAFQMHSSNQFPFVSFSTTPGLRPANGVYQDNFTQKSTFDIKTSRDLWKGAKLDLSWNTDLSYNRNQTVTSDSFCIPHFSNILVNESFNRTFLSLPSVFGINFFGNDAENIIKIYNQRAKAIDANNSLDSLSKNRHKMLALSDAFYDGLEAFSFSSGSIGKFLPAVNWKLNWEGLEKWPIWHGWVKKATFEHAYTSKYTEVSQVTDNGKVIQQQASQTGFQPLIGIHVTLDQKKTNGLVNATFKWNSTNQYSVTTANRSTISRQSSEELQIQASYAMNNFEFPLFGINLKNELEFSALVSYKMNKTATYDITKSTNPADGRSLDGNKQVIVEPRVTYSISNAVKASAFVRYEGTFNEGAGTPGFTTFQIGMDLRISLSGGR